MKELTVAIGCCKTVFPYAVGKNSPLLFRGTFAPHSETFTMYIVGKKSPMTLTKSKFRGVDIVSIFQNDYFTNMLDSCHHLEMEKRHIDCCSLKKKKKMN